MSPQLEAIAMLNLMFESHDGRIVDNSVLTRKDYKFLVEVLAASEALLQECRNASDDTHIHAAIDAFILDLNAPRS